MADPTVSQLVVQRESIKSRIAGLGDLSPGSLVDGFSKCGKPNCRCAKPGQAGHGPSWPLTHGEKGKTVTFVIPADRAPQTLEQIAECQRLRALTQDLIDVSEKICDARISDHKANQPSKKASLAEQLAVEVAAEIDSLLGRGSSDEIDLEAIETAARRQVPGLAARAIEQKINADSSDYAGTHLPCCCGEQARYAGRRAKSFQSVLGELKLKRAYYHCRACSTGFCPRDLKLSIEKTCLSPAVSRMVGRVGAMVSFEEGSQLLEKLAGLRIDASQVERGAETLGEEIAADEQRYTEPLEETPLPPTLYMGLDGTGIPMRAAELADAQASSPTVRRKRVRSKCA